MEDFPAEDTHDIISIQIDLQQDFKWMWVTHGVFTKWFALLDKEIKKNCDSVMYDTLRSLFTN